MDADTAARRLKELAEYKAKLEEQLQLLHAEPTELRVTISHKRTVASCVPRDLLVAGLTQIYTAQVGNAVNEIRSIGRKLAEPENVAEARPK